MDEFDPRLEGPRFRDESRAPVTLTDSRRRYIMLTLQFLLKPNGQNEVEREGLSVHIENNLMRSPL